MLEKVPGSLKWAPCRWFLFIVPNWGFSWDNWRREERRGRLPTTGTGSETPSLWLSCGSVFKYYLWFSWIVSERRTSRRNEIYRLLLANSSRSEHLRFCSVCSGLWNHGESSMQKEDFTYNLLLLLILTVFLYHHCCAASTTVTDKVCLYFPRQRNLRRKATHSSILVARKETVPQQFC